MPIAKGGDLTRRKHQYKNALDDVLKVAKQIADALAAVHAREIIHRDIKPQNILFTGEGHDIVVSDFGICLIEDEERWTQIGEIVGPRHFIAPELEIGGPDANVGPAADIYSFGKLIAYMISGGCIVPREDLSILAEFFSKDHRHELLRDLLSRMICGPDLRLSQMSTVIESLKQIETQRSGPIVAALTHKSMEAMRTLKRKAVEAKRIEAGRQIPDEERAANAVVASLAQHVALQLEDLSAELNAGGHLNSIVSRDHAVQRGAFFPSTRRDSFSTIFKWELRLQPVQRDSASVLMFLLCVKIMDGPLHGCTAAHDAQQKDPFLWFVPVFQRISSDRLEVRTKTIGYFKSVNSQNIDLTRPTDLQVPSELNDVFDQEANLNFGFRVSQWPGAARGVDRVIVEAIEMFLTIAINDSSGV
jgi:serine/threonine protein kinase